MQLDIEETKLIVASLEMMQRLMRDDSTVSRFEREKVERVTRSIKTKFHNAIFSYQERGQISILTPDGALNPDGGPIDGRDIFPRKI